MYQDFKNISYPLVAQAEGILGQSARVANSALNNFFIDFRLIIYSANISSSVYCIIEDLSATGSDLVLKLRVLSVLTPPTSGTALTYNYGETLGVLTLKLDKLNESPFLRVYFDTTDFTEIDPLIVTALEGHLALNNVKGIVDFIDANPSESFAGDPCGFCPDSAPGGASRYYFEPHTISVIGNHRVDLINLKQSNPLFIQTTAGSLTNLGSISGNVNFVAGRNCVITVVPATNSVIIEAVTGANGGTESEVCGVWGSALNSDDTLCNQGVYSLGGAIPDTQGDIQLIAEYPLRVSSLSKLETPAGFHTLLNTVPYVNKFITIDAAASSLNNPDASSCNPVILPPPTAECNII